MKVLICEGIEAMPIYFFGINERMHIAPEAK